MVVLTYIDRPIRSLLSSLGRPAFLAGAAWAAMTLSGCTSPKGQLSAQPQSASSKLAAMGESVGDTMKAGGSKIAAAFKPKTTVTSAGAAWHDTHTTWWPFKKEEKPGAEFYVSLAQVHEQSGDDNQAVGQYERALQEDPKFLPALVGYAHVLDRQGHKIKATEYYLQAAKVAPKDASVINDLGLCYARQGKFDEALHYLERAVELKPDRELYRNNIATLLVELGRVDEAVNQIAAVYGEPIAHYNVGVLLKQQGKWPAAARQLALAVEKDPGLQQARVLLDELNTDSMPREQIASTPLIEKTSSVEVEQTPAAEADVPQPDPASPVVVKSPTRVASRLPVAAPTQTTVRMSAPATDVSDAEVAPGPESYGKVWIKQDTVPTAVPATSMPGRTPAQTGYIPPSRY